MNDWKEEEIEISLKIKIKYTQDRELAVEMAYEVANEYRITAGGKKGHGCWAVYIGKKQEI